MAGFNSYWMQQIRQAILFFEILFHIYLKSSYFNHLEMFLNASSKLPVLNSFSSFSLQLTHEGFDLSPSAKTVLFKVTKILYMATFKDQFSGFALAYILDVAECFLPLETYSSLASTTCSLKDLFPAH